MSNGIEARSRLPATVSDYELLKRARTGDEEAFICLYRRRQGGVYRFALQMSGSESAAEDVTQEVFLTLMGDPSGYDESRGTVSAYLYGITRNFVLRRLDKESRFVCLPDDETQEGEFANRALSASDPLHDLTRTESIEAVRQAVLLLPPRYREVVVLCDLHETSYAEAAAAIGCAVGTVRSRLHRARMLLAERLRDAHGAASSKKVLSSQRSYA